MEDDEARYIDTDMLLLDTVAGAKVRELPASPIAGRRVVLIVDDAYWPAQWDPVRLAETREKLREFYARGFPASLSVADVGVSTRVDAKAARPFYACGPGFSGELAGRRLTMIAILAAFARGGR